MPAPRLASDCPTHVLYPCSHDATSEHTTDHHAAAIARPARAGAALTRISLDYRDSPCRGIPRYRDHSLPPYNGFVITTRNHGAPGAGPASALAGSFVESLAAQDFAKLGAGWFTVEQHAYADTDESGRIAQIDLLCTGYRPEGGHD